MSDAVRYLGPLASGLALALLMRRIVRPTSRLGPRLRPFTVGSRVALGRDPSLGGTLAPASLRQLMGAVADRLGKAVEGSGEEAMLLKLRQAGLIALSGSEDRLAEYRMRQFLASVGWTAASFSVGLALAVRPTTALLLGASGFVVGITRWRARLERAIERRVERMNTEIYTVDQLLALQIRAGLGVIRAVQRIVLRGSGDVVSELREVLRLHRAGLSGPEAFRHLAALTPASHCRRTYALLAAAEERGSDLAAGLMAMAEDVREARRQQVARRGTRQRAAMLIPVIVFLAPVMLLFIAAPLPQILFGIR